MCIKVVCVERECTKRERERERDGKCAQDRGKECVYEIEREGVCVAIERGCVER